jgi:hypothetical protein
VRNFDTGAEGVGTRKSRRELIGHRAGPSIGQRLDRRQGANELSGVELSWLRHQLLNEACTLRVDAFGA